MDVPDVPEELGDLILEYLTQRPIHSVSVVAEAVALHVWGKLVSMAKYLWNVIGGRFEWRPQPLIQHQPPGIIPDLPFQVIQDVAASNETIPGPQVGNLTDNSDLEAQRIVPGSTPAAKDGVIASDQGNATEEIDLEAQTGEADSSTVTTV